MPKMCDGPAHSFGRCLDNAPVVKDSNAFLILLTNDNFHHILQNIIVKQ